MKFTPIYPSDYSRLKGYARNQVHPLCVYSLPCLLVWYNSHYHPVAAEHEGLLLVAGEYFAAPHKSHLILPFVPHGDPQLPPDRLWQLAQQAGYSQYRWVPHTYLDYFQRSSISRWFHISRQKEFDDYIYRQSDLAQLRGNPYAKKRNLINQFQRDYLASKRSAVEAICESNAAECLEFLDEWCAERDCAPENNLELACEKDAATHMLNHIGQMDVRGLLARVDSRVQAFAVGARLTATMGVLHFEKAASTIKGLYQYFDQECARRLFADCDTINKESDMNIPGLARAKKSYHPIHRVRAYKFMLKT